MLCKFLLTLLFVEILCCAGTPGNNADVSQRDHFKLALVWPNTFCWTQDVQCRPTVPQYFVVRSFWAETKSKSLPPIIGCTTDYELTDSMILRHKSDLLKYWPDLTTYNFDDSKQLWKEQWQTYGSCGVDQMLPESYITSALIFRQKNNFYQILKNSDIQANGSSYSPQTILSAIKKVTKTNVDLVCEADTQGTVFVSEIHQCLDKAGTKFIDCQGESKKCDKNPVFPDPNYAG